MSGWNRNAHYHDIVLAAAPRPCHRALDIGCGVGDFARHLARIAGHVDALDRDPVVIAKARDRTTATNVRFVEVDFLGWSTGARYDLISMIATLHHLPFADAIAKAVSLLAPNGVLAVIGLYREHSLLDLAASAIALPVSWSYRLARGEVAVDAPMRDPEMTLAEIRRATSELLPGAVVRRHLLWRYSVVFNREP